MEFVNELAKSIAVLDWTKEEIATYQKEKISELLSYIYEKSPYYRRAMDCLGKDFKAITLEDLPLMNKSSLYEHYDEIVCNRDICQTEVGKYVGRLYLDKYIVVHSSGSSGMPRYYLYDQESSRKICIAHFRAAFSVCKENYMELLAGIDRVLFIAELGGAYGGASFFCLSMQSSQMQWETLDIHEPLERWNHYLDKKPSAIIAYASALKILLELDYDYDFEIRMIVSSGEPLSPQLRAALEDKFKCPVINLYCASESMIIGAEINGTEGVFLMEDMVYTELIDGKLYITNLYNFDQPIIRYYIGDAVTLAKDLEHPTFAFKRINAPQRRDDDIMWFTNESAKNRCRDFFHPFFVDTIAQEGLLDYQFIKDSDHSFKILYTLTSKDYQEEVCAALCSTVDKVLEQKTMDYVSYKTECVDYIPVDSKTGKKKLMIVQVH